MRRLGILMLAVLLAGAMGMLAARPAAAHGGVVYIDDNYGAFHLVVQVNPTPNDREVRYTILVNQPDYGDPIADAQVSLHAVLTGTQAGGAPPVEQPVPPEPGQDGFYDLTMAMPTYGDWRVTVQVQRGAAASAAAFTLPLQAAPDLTSPVWLLALLPVAVGAVAAVFLYFWRVPGKTPPAPPMSTDSGETTST